MPGWIKTAAGHWVDGATTDAEFAAAIGFLVSRGVIDVPPTAGGGSGEGGSIPEWIKTTTGYWTEGYTSDAEFVGAVQFLMRAGIIVVE